MRQAQYTDTWTCHLHRESRVTPHTGITPPHRSRPWSNEMWLQKTQPTSGGAVTADLSCCANCVEPPRPQQWGPGLPFWGMPAMRTRWMAGAAAHKAGDVETNPGPTTLNKKVWICDICRKQIHVRKQISIRCNRIEHWVHLRCAGMRQAQYTDTWTCHLHR